MIWVSFDLKTSGYCDHDSGSDGGAGICDGASVVSGGVLDGVQGEQYQIETHPL
jgi:hypothetical protein